MTQCVRGELGQSGTASDRHSQWGAIFRTAESDLRPKAKALPPAKRTRGYEAGDDTSPSGAATPVIAIGLASAPGRSTAGRGSTARAAATPLIATGLASAPGYPAARAAATPVIATGLVSGTGRSTAGPGPAVRVTAAPANAVLYAERGLICQWDGGHGCSRSIYDVCETDGCNMSFCEDHFELHNCESDEPPPPLPSTQPARLPVAAPSGIVVVHPPPTVRAT